MARLGIDRAELGRRGVKKSALSRILGSGDRGIGADVAAKLAKAMRLRAEYFIADPAMSIEDAMLPPPGPSAPMRRLAEASFPAEMDRATLGIRERLLTIARALGRPDLLPPLLDAHPRSAAEATDPIWWLDRFAEAAAVPARQATPTPTPMPASDVVQRRAR